jgi:hypothetical protein
LPAIALAKAGYNDGPDPGQGQAVIIETIINVLKIMYLGEN